MYAHLLPRELRIGATRYRIVARDDEFRRTEGVDGQVRFADLEIDLVVDRPASELANTLIHELLHVCYREWHIKPRCGEERTVTALGFALAALYAQNPAILTSIRDLMEAAENE
jgi:hypothetical protein